MFYNDISTTLDQHKIIEINDQFIYQLITIIIDFNQQSQNGDIMTGMTTNSDHEVFNINLDTISGGTMISQLDGVKVFPIVAAEEI